ncbi:hypothetical protein [Streptomyces sp. B8F3]|uniref:hypothetical protein n=1 Tax=unclassified Streptomyces TaxID=2593676 RepID=UPI00325CF4BD
MPDVESAVLDLSGVSLASLRSMDGPAIVASLERLMQHIDHPPAVLAGGYGAQRID